MSSEEQVERKDSAMDPMRFEASTDKRILENFLESLTAIVDEARFHLHPGAIHVRATGAPNVACVESTLHLETETAPAGGGSAVGVNVSHLEDLVEPIPSLSSDDASVRVDDETLTVAKGATAVSIDTIDEEKIRSDPSDSLDEGMEFTVEARLDLAQLRNFADELPTGASSVVLRLVDRTDGGRGLTATAEEGGWTFEQGFEGSTITKDPGEDVMAAYSADYVRSVWGNLPPLSGTVEFADGHPIRITYQDDRQDVVYYTAPRISAGDGR